MALVIRKRVSLDFLGEEYKDAYITFKAIPLKDFEELQTEIESIGDDNKKSLTFISEKLKHYFLNGQAPNEAGKLENIVVDDVDNLDQESILKCFQVLSGQSINEDSDFLDKPSSKPSSTEVAGPTN